MATHTNMMYARASGMRTFQPSAISWSYRKRGRVQRIHITKKIQNITLRKKNPEVAMVWSTPPVSSQWVNGMSHPPKNRVVTMAHTVTTFEYSAMKKKENFMALYSVWYPAINSDSASGMSNGSRLVSANPAIRKMKKERKSGRTYHRPSCWSRTMAERLTLPDRSRTGIKLRPIATSYDTIWA